jgi:hypothetical protein
MGDRLRHASRGGWRALASGLGEGQQECLDSASIAEREASAAIRRRGGVRGAWVDDGVPNEEEEQKKEREREDSREIPLTQHPTPSSSFNDLSNSPSLLFLSPCFDKVFDGISP